MSSSPHDALFRRTFSNVEHAAAELRCVLPSALLARIDLRTLRQVAGSFVDTDLVAAQSDLLFSVDVDGKPGFLYLLCEHQSTVDPFMALRVLKYVVRLLERHVDGLASGARALPLPIVLPIVLHHSETGWTAPLEVQSLFDPTLLLEPALAQYVPKLRFLLDDISHMSDETLAARALGFVPTLTLWALRDARTPERLLRSLTTWAAAMNALVAAESGREALLTIFRYLSLVVSDETRDSLRRVLSSSAPQVEHVVMTTMAEAWLAEGEARGRAEGEARGRAEGIRAVLRQLLEVRFGPLGEAEAKRLESAGEEQLARWSLRVLSADSVAAVLAE